jgi:hypothetical protein
MQNSVKVIGKIELPIEKSNSICKCCKNRFYSSDDLDLCYICNDLMMYEEMYYDDFTATSIAEDNEHGLIG